MVKLLRSLKYRLFKPHSLWHMRHYPAKFKVKWATPPKTKHNYIKGFPASLFNPLRKIEMICPSLYLLKQGHSNNLAILASGPSINDMDWKHISQVDVALVNGAIRLADKIPEANSDNKIYFLVTDPNFILMNFKRIKANIPQKTLFIFSVRAAYELMKQDLSFFYDNHEKIYLIDQVHEPYNQKKLKPKQILKKMEGYQEVLFDMNQNIGFSADPRFGFFNGGTVVHSMLQIAAYLNYTHIEVFGMDLGGSVRFYKERKHAPSYLDRDYERLILPSMKLAGKYAQRKAVQIFNKSPASRLPNDIFKG